MASCRVLVPDTPVSVGDGWLSVTLWASWLRGAWQTGLAGHHQNLLCRWATGTLHLGPHREAPIDAGANGQQILSQEEHEHGQDERDGLMVTL